MVAFPDRRAGVGLYAFVEADISERALEGFVGVALGPTKAPERMQVVAALPRRADGEVRSEILELVAMNQVDLIDPLMRNEEDRAFSQGHPEIAEKSARQIQLQVGRPEFARALTFPHCAHGRQCPFTGDGAII